jgi:PAS domain-containing protein
MFEDDEMFDERRWIQEIARLRARAARVRRRPSGSDECEELLDAALETCDGVLRALASADRDNETLTRRCHAEAATYAHLFEHLPLAAIETDAEGRILQANGAASRLLNTSTKHLTSRLFLHFTEDRAAFLALLRALSTGSPGCSACLTVRPRERAPRRLSASIIPAAPGESATWVWFLAPVHGTDVHDDTTRPARAERAAPIRGGASVAQHDTQQ